MRCPSIIEVLHPELIDQLQAWTASEAELAVRDHNYDHTDNDEPGGVPWHILLTREQGRFVGFIKAINVGDIAIEYELVARITE